MTLQKISSCKIQFGLHHFYCLSFYRLDTANGARDVFSA